MISYWKNLNQRNMKMFVNLEEVLKKFLEFKNDDCQLVENINNLREKMKKLGIKVPLKLVSKLL